MAGDMTKLPVMPSTPLNRSVYDRACPGPEGHGAPQPPHDHRRANPWEKSASAT